MTSQTRARPRWRLVSTKIARIALLVLPLLWLSKKVDVRGIANSMMQVGIGRLALGLSLQLCIVVVVSIRWRTLLITYGAARRPALLELVRANLVANYFALLPLPAADEGVRVLRTVSLFPGARLSPYLVLVAERLTGLVGLLLLALTASLASRRALSEPALHALTFGCLVAFILAMPALALPGLLKSRPAWRSQVARIPVVGPTLSRLEPPARRLDLMISVAISALGHFGSCAVIALLFWPLDPRATLSLCTQVQPVVLLAMSFALTPGGVGQRELVFAALYGLAGVASTSAVTVSLLSFSLALAQAAVGGLVYACERLCEGTGSPTVSPAIAPDALGERKSAEGGDSIR